MENTPPYLGRNATDARKAYREEEKMIVFLVWYKIEGSSPWMEAIFTTGEKAKNYLQVHGFKYNPDKNYYERKCQLIRAVIEEREIE